jgi:hypothetical protein
VSADLLNRIGRDTALICAAGAALAWAIGGWRAAAGVLGGGVLIGISVASVAFTVAAFVGSGAGSARRDRSTRALAGAVFVLHYALLAFVAYVMIARLRLHPIGLVGGVTSFVLAAALEAARARGRR